MLSYFWVTLILLKAQMTYIIYRLFPDASNGFHQWELHLPNIFPIAILVFINGFQLL